jgi:excisionase family DNA binding protein
MKQPESEPALVTAEEAASRLGVSRRAIYEMVRQGRLPKIEFGTSRIYIPRAQFERLLEDMGACEPEPEPIDAAAVREKLIELRRELDGLLDLVS